MQARIVLRFFFWIAFAVFLLASIPHVAYFFRAFEPASGAWYWFIAYALALSIDITTFLLSLTAAELMRRDADQKIVASVWFFILLLAGLSWLMNWEYAYQFSSGMLVRPASIGMVNSVNPIIASCFQTLAIAYTWISDKIAQSEIAPRETAISEQLPEIASQVTEIAELQDTKRLQILREEIKPSDQEIMQFLAEHPEMKQKEIAHELHISESRISRLKNPKEAKGIA